MKYYVYTGINKIYFNSYSDAKNYVRYNAPDGLPKGLYHIYPVDKSGYYSKPEGRISFGEGCKYD